MPSCCHPSIEGSANVARHLLDERHELNESLSLARGASRRRSHAWIDSGSAWGRPRDLRLAHRDPLEQPDQKVCRGHRRRGAGRHRMFTGAEGWR